MPAPPMMGSVPALAALSCCCQLKPLSLAPITH